MGEGQDKCAKEFEVTGKDWKKYTVTLSPPETVSKGKLRVFLVKPETTVDLEHLSSSLPTRGKGVRMVCAMTWFRNLQILNPVCSVSPVDVSLRARIWIPAMSGKRQSVRLRTAR